MQTVAARMARWVRALDYDRLPPEVVGMAKRCILDYAGVALRGSTLPQVRPVHAYVLELEAKPVSTIVGAGGKTTPAYAAYVNGTFGHSCEFDDAHHLCGHPGVVVIPAILALAEAHGKSGREVITALVAGYEMMVKAAACIHSHSLHLGWHSMKVFGVFGAAAAAARLMDMDEDQIVNAFGIAGSEASGAMEYDQSGGEVKRLHGGSAGRLGLQSALLAQKGLTGPSTIFEGKRGIWRMFSDALDAEPETFWAKDFYIGETMFKMWPAVGTVHGAINAAEEIRARHTVDPSQIEAIDVEVSELTFTHGATIVRPHDALSAQFSLAFSLALTFGRGGNRLDDYLDPEAWTDPALLALAEKVTPIQRDTAPGASILGAKVMVRMQGGEVLSFDQPVPKGLPGNPASDADIEAKFRGLVGGLTSPEQADAIIAGVRNLEGTADAGDLARLLVL